MDKYKETLILIESNKFTLSELVSILILIVSKINIDTVSGMARRENKQPSGIRNSNQYRKLMIGCQKMVVAGLQDVNLPF